MAESMATVAIREALEGEWHEGYDKGYAHGNSPRPNWFVNPYYVMSAWQRGFIFGRELALLEANGH